MTKKKTADETTVDGWKEPLPGEEHPLDRLTPTEYAVPGASVGVLPDEDRLRAGGYLAPERQVEDDAKLQAQRQAIANAVRERAAASHLPQLETLAQEIEQGLVDQDVALAANSEAERATDLGRRRLQLAARLIGEVGTRYNFQQPVTLEIERAFTAAWNLTA